MTRALKLVLLAAAVAVYAAFGWIAGLTVATVVLVGLIEQYVRSRQALAPEIACPWCRRPVPQYGAYSCGSCRSRTIGWVWRCSACNAWTGHTQCPHCEMSVPNPLLGRP